MMIDLKSDNNRTGIVAELLLLHHIMIDLRVILQGQCEVALSTQMINQPL